MESCFVTPSFAKGDDRVRSSLVEFFVAEVWGLMQDPDFRCYHAAALQNCLQVLQSVGGPSPPEFEAITAFPNLTAKTKNSNVQLPRSRPTTTRWRTL